MAERPIFVPIQMVGEPLVKIINIEFEWFPGFSISQKQKSIQSLHEAASDKGYNTLEISSKSPDELGVVLSAFNLPIYLKSIGKNISVESAFQGSKVFENGQQYSDLYDKSSLEAKKDIRIKTSGRLKKFSFEKNDWELQPTTAFYDWLYINALYQKENSIREKILKYSAFSDIEFNPKKSLNCQAYSAALFVSLYKNGFFNNTLPSKEKFLEYLNEYKKTK